MRSAKYVAPGGGRADVGIGPTRYRRIQAEIGSRFRAAIQAAPTAIGGGALGRCVQHGLQENSIAPGGVVYQDMGDGSQ